MLPKCIKRLLSTALPVAEAPPPPGPSPQPLLERQPSAESQSPPQSPLEPLPEPQPRPRTPAQVRGDAAEAAAAQFLIERGHRVVERNWRAGRDEIDLITIDGPCLVFVEVRARAAGALVGGYHSIDRRKKAALRRVCSAYLQAAKPRPQTYRLDAVQIALGKGGQMEIHHYAGLALFN